MVRKLVAVSAPKFWTYLRYSTLNSIQTEISVNICIWYRKVAFLLPNFGPSNVQTFHSVPALDTYDFLTCTRLATLLAHQYQKNLQNQ
jgi:hypothetical protein